MNYTRVFVARFVATLPEEVVTTAELEERLAPVYARLRLPTGRLELMTGIRERRLWRTGTSITDASVRTVAQLLDEVPVAPARIGALIHASVCRDFLEPATACGVHHRLGLPASCCAFDVSNACLGLLTGMTHVANMIELGQIEAGIVVGSESSRSLMEATIAYLNTCTTLNRQSIKKDFASLTIGSGSAAVFLASARLAEELGMERSWHRLLGGTSLAKTAFCHLCQSDTDQSGGDTMRPLMQTDSESLMHEGVAAAAEAFPTFLSEVGWSRESIATTFCHQVGKAHQQLLLERLGLSPAINYATLDFLGNTGSVALPTAAALGLRSGFAVPGDRIALLGIGSGINVVMLALE